MKISLNWLRDYLDIDLSIDQISEYLTEMGLEVEGIEEVQSIPGGLKGLVVGEVLSADPHENADKLKVTRVDVNQEEIYQIVCGAPNVNVGQKVIVALPGTIIHPIEGSPFEIKKAKIRGIESFGMICAEDEIGIGNSHDGIMILEPDTKVGLSAAKYFNLESDYIFEIGLTPNRSDANSHIGVARDLSAFLNFNQIQENELKLPQSELVISAPTKEINIEVKDANACPRYTAVLIEGVQVKPSPDWLRQRIQSIGVKPINNVVDITNFVLHEMGQPLHAFDATAIKGNKIIVGTLKEKSLFTTLDGQNIELNSTDLMILDSDNKGLCLAGVYGGQYSGVSEGTVDVILECAHFDAKGIRRTSMRHDLRTDAAKTFEKGADPNSCYDALCRAANLIVEIAGGKIASEIKDVYPKLVEKANVNIDCEAINKLLGLQIDEGGYKRLFACLEFDIYESNFPKLSLKIPTYKTDVLREADVAEEVLRIYGLNKVELPQFMHIPNVAPELITDLNLKNKISEMLHGAGFMESMSLSFSQSRYVKDLGLELENELVFVNNTSNTHLDILRPNMLFSVLENIQYNQNRQQRGARFFEFGRKYLKNGDRYDEVQQLTLTLWGKKHADHWKMELNGKYDFYDLKSSVENILKTLGIEKFKVAELQSEEFAYGQRWTLGAVEIVSFGSVGKKMLKYFDIKDEVFVSLIHWDNVFRMLKKEVKAISEISKFPTVQRDFSLTINEKTTFGEIEQVVLSAGKPAVKSCSLFDIYRDEKNVGIDMKSYAISIMFEDKTKTLTEAEIEKSTGKIREQLSKRLSAEIRN